MIEIRQGVSLILEYELEDVDGNPVDSVGAQAIFAYGKGSTTTQKDCLILENLLTVELTPEETRVLSGTYEFEVKVKDLFGRIDCYADGKFSVKRSRIPDYS